MIALRLLPFSRAPKIIKHTIRKMAKPENYSLSVNTVTDLTHSKTELIVENVFLRQQLLILQRQVKRPLPRPRERVLLVGLASRLNAWKQALLIVQPDTLLRWHRDLFRWLWKRKSKSAKKPGRNPLQCSVVELIQRMAQENRTWGANVFGVNC